MSWRANQFGIYNIPNKRIKFQCCSSSLSIATEGALALIASENAPLLSIFPANESESVILKFSFIKLLTFHSDSSDNPFATKSDLTFKNAFLSDASVNLLEDQVCPKITIGMHLCS